MMNDRVELMDKELVLVNGGDYDDSRNDFMSEPKYKVDESVEVYNTVWHRSTTQNTVQEARFDRASNCWIYRVDKSEKQSNYWIFADDIEARN